MKKSTFWTFFFSLMPGCGLMYLGYMKKGLQVMLMFAAAGFLGAFFLSYITDWFGGFFFLLLPIIWFYQMFDALHTVARMKNQGIELPADDGFFLPDKALQFSPARNRTAAKVLATFLILVGSFSLVLGVLENLWRLPGFDQEILHYLLNGIRNGLIPAIVSILLIFVGIRLLKGDKVKKTDVYGKEGGLP